MAGLGGTVGLIVADLVIAAAVAGTTKAAMMGRLKPNALAGIRTSATRSSPQAWVAAHRAAWPWAVGIGVVGVLGAVSASVLLALGRPDAAEAVAWIPLVVLAVGAIPVVLVANRAAGSV
ncbi:MAG: SdpI family protein [Dermatophilaceae bacterium]